MPSEHHSRSRCDSCVVVDCDCAGAKKSAASKTAGWRYIVISLFKDYERVRRLYPHLHPTREDDCDTNNCCEAFHSVMKTLLIRYVTVTELPSTPKPCVP